MAVCRALWASRAHVHVFTHADLFEPSRAPPSQVINDVGSLNAAASIESTLDSEAHYEKLDGNNI